MSEHLLTRRQFKSLPISDRFFDSLKADYAEFESWYTKKGDNTAFVFTNPDTEQIDGFLYVKVEHGAVNDVTPPLPDRKWLKVGTFKVNPHGTRLGERFIKRCFDVAISNDCDSLYVTIFEKHSALVSLFKRFGFKLEGIKKTANGEELVLCRILTENGFAASADYPCIPYDPKRIFALSIYPQWHSRLLPDSLLKTETASAVIEDTSHTNSIDKIYLTAMKGVETLATGDTLVIYRTKDNGSAHYTSVVTTVCVVQGISHISSFETSQAFVDHCLPYSIFDANELNSFYNTKKYPWLIHFTYNLALTKRINRKALIEDIGLDPSIYWGFFQISREQFINILKRSGDYEKVRSLIYSPTLRRSNS
jgi:hypothetical protein